MHLRRRGFLHLAAGALALPALPRLSVADSYPSRRITMVVPFAPGALSDIIARVMAEGMQASLGQTVVVENAGGADGTIGSGRVAHAVPDGYTLVCANWNTSVTNAAIYKLDYDVVTDFEPVVLLPAAPMVLLTKKDNPATNLTEFIAWLKANSRQGAQAARHCLRRRQSARPARPLAAAGHRHPPIHGSPIAAPHRRCKMSSPAISTRCSSPSPPPRRRCVPVM